MRGNAKDLCSAGPAVEFIQPHGYIPLTTVPGNTGMALGGIGSAFTVTPAGTTPTISFLPGLHVTGKKGDIRLQNFLFAEASIPDVNDLYFEDFAKFQSINEFFPLLDKDYQPLIANDLSEAEALAILKAGARAGTIYNNNKDDFRHWHTEFTTLTKSLIEEKPNDTQTQIRVLLEFYNGALARPNSYKGSLVGDIEETSIAGQPTYPAEHMQYSALYPRAEFSYEGEQSIQIKRTQASPIVRGDVKLCSLPVSWNTFKLHNPTKKTKEVTLLQTQQNMMGFSVVKMRPGVQDAGFNLVKSCFGPQAKSFTQELPNGENLLGVTLSDKANVADFKGEMCIAVVYDSNDPAFNVSIKPSYYSTQEDIIVKTALTTGRLSYLYNSGVHSGRELKSSAICAAILLQPGETKSITFALTIDIADIELQDWVTSKYYVNHFPEKYNRAKDITAFAMENRLKLETKVSDEQKAFLSHFTNHFDNSKDQEKFATMALNTLSFLADATVWDIKNKFLVRECADYPFFNSLDVYFYGSFALLYLLPELDGHTMKYFADAVLAEDLRLRRYWEYVSRPFAVLRADSKYEGFRAVRGAVVHDLGSPFDIKPDAYNWHNVKEWKDLAPKFVLMVYRHYKYTGNQDVLTYCWQAVSESIAYLENLIYEGEHIPLTNGTDDTFDNLSSYGISVYSASLWVAGLRAATEIAKLLDHVEKQKHYTALAKLASQDFDSALWDEQEGYYHFFVTPISDKHLNTNTLAESSKGFTKLGLEITGDKSADLKTLNKYLNDRSLSNLENLQQELVEIKNTGVDVSPKTALGIRRLKKHLLARAAPTYFSKDYEKILDLDSDDSFGDSLLADTYLQLLGLEPINSMEKRLRVLDKVFSTNFKANSPKLGVANMTNREGEPLEAFQAQDVWIGVQFSVATALWQAGKKSEFQELLETVYDSLYNLSKIPFAAPEGFNSSRTINTEELAKALDFSLEEASACLAELMKVDGFLLADKRVNPSFPSAFAEFDQQLGNTPLESLEANIKIKLHKFIQATGLKYTAGRYFRPGMIFALHGCL